MAKKKGRSFLQNAGLLSISDEPVARFSDDRKYRYTLIRQLDDRIPLLDIPSIGTTMFIMLNPSTADEVQDDPTIRRCRRFATKWGSRWLIICNTSPLRATDPKVLKAAGSEPLEIWRENMIQIERMAQLADRLVVAWGNYGRWCNRDKIILKMIREKTHLSPRCLGFTKTGFPRHPLYLPADAEPTPYEITP